MLMKIFMGGCLLEKHNYYTSKVSHFHRDLSVRIRNQFLVKIIDRRSYQFLCISCPSFLLSVTLKSRGMKCVCVFGGRGSTVLLKLVRQALLLNLTFHLHCEYELCSPLWYVMFA